VKLLFDHNLSPKLIDRLADLFPSSEHVYRVNLDESADRVICDYATANDFVVVTKDADYETLSVRPNAPSIVWIRRGNCSTDDVERVIRDHGEQIRAFADHDTAQLLILL
jgi:predicted nuclease of predicted toxin-antitoxin system